MIMGHNYNTIKQLLLIVFLLVIQAGFSQPQNFQLKQISVEHGLPGNTVRAIFQDSKDILWFAVESAGLCRYDGVTFTLYSNNNKDSCSLGNNFVNTICEDTDGYLWIGTENGLFRFDRMTEKFKPYYSIENNKNSLYGNQILMIKVQPQGKLWVGTDKGVNVYDKENDQFVCIPYFENGHELNFQVNSICFDSLNNTWLGTLAGLLKFDYNTQKFTRWVNKPHDPNSLFNDEIKGVGFDRQGSLWITSAAGCTKYNPKQDRFYEIKALNQYEVTGGAVMLDRKGFIWLHGIGLAIVDTENNSFKIYQHSFDDPDGLRQNNIRAIYEDKSGLVWIGTKFEGIQIYNNKRELFPHWKNQTNNNHKGLNNKNVYSICEDKNGKLYFGTREGGLNVMDSKTGTFTYYIHDGNNPLSIAENDIYTILADHQNNIWIASTDYLQKFDIQQKTFIHYPINRIRSLFEDSNGTLWVGRKPGLFIFDKVKCTLTAFYDSSNVFPDSNDFDIDKLFEDREKHLWIGTYRDGLFDYNPTTGKMVHYRNDPNDSTTLSNDMIRSIYEDSAGRLWIGTKLQRLKFIEPLKSQFYEIYN